MKPRVQFKNEPQIWESPRRSRQRGPPPTASVPETSPWSVYPASHRAEARASLLRVQEIQKFAKVLPHCSAPVRLNHLARCKPLKGSFQGQSESFESLFYHLSSLAVTHQNKQRPLPTNNFPKIPRRSKQKRLSSNRHHYSQPRPAPDPAPSNATANFQRDRKNSVRKPCTLTTITASSETSKDIFYEQSASRVQTPVIIVSTPTLKEPKLIERFLKRDKTYTELSTLLSENFQGKIENIKIPDIKLINPGQFIDVLEMLKQKAINLEIEIQKNTKIESIAEARQHIQSLESTLIRVMPLMNLLTSLVRFNHMFEEYQRSETRPEEKDLLFDIHRVESEVLLINCNISRLTYKLEYKEMHSYSNGRGDTECGLDSVLTQITSEQARLEALASAQTETEEGLLGLRREVQSYVGSKISGAGNGSGLFMLNIDTQLGMVMLTLSQIGKKRISALEQVSELIQNKMLKHSEKETREPTPNLEKPIKSSKDLTRSDDEYIKIIDKLTKEMFEDKGSDIPRRPPKYSSLLKTSPSSRSTQSESEYERVMRELDTKLEIQQKGERGERGEGGTRMSSGTQRSRERREPSLEMIDKMFGPPDKISIPERYQSFLDVETENKEDKEERALDIRKLLVDVTGQSEADLQKSQEIAQLAVTKSVLLAASASKKGKPDDFDDIRENDNDSDESPASALPVTQQRDSFIL